MPILKITWRIKDDNACPKCKVLNGYIWTLRVGQDAFPTVLPHPAFGAVWSISAGSMAHGHRQFNCRCTLDIPDQDMDFSDLLSSVQKLYDGLLLEYGSPEIWAGIRTVTVQRSESGRFVTWRKA